MKQWKKEKEQGSENQNLDNEIQSELENPVETSPPKNNEVEPPPVPIPVVRF